MKELKLPEVELRTRNTEGKQEVFDVVRKKFVRLTAEEWVRQHFLHYLINQKQTPPSLIAVETSVRYNKMDKRCDMVVYNRTGKPALIVECKAPEVAISQDVFHQVAMYNMSLKVRFLIVTNGLEHYACRIDFDKGTYQFLKDIPDFEELNKSNHLA